MADQNRSNEQGPGRDRDEESIGVGSRDRSNREPAETADDRGMGESDRNLDNIDELSDDTAVESDIDEVDDLDDEGDHSNR